MAEAAIPFPVVRRDVPRSQAYGATFNEKVIALYPGQHAFRAEPLKLSPEMMIILALISALEKRQGLKTIKTKTFYALTGQDDRADGDYRPPSAAFRAAVDALCGS